MSWLAGLTFPLRGSSLSTWLAPAGLEVDVEKSQARPRSSSRSRNIDLTWDPSTVRALPQAASDGRGFHPPQAVTGPYCRPHQELECYGDTGTFRRRTEGAAAEFNGAARVHHLLWPSLETSNAQVRLCSAHGGRGHGPIDEPRADRVPAEFRVINKDSVIRTFAPPLQQRTGTGA